MTSAAKFDERRKRFILSCGAFVALGTVLHGTLANKLRSRADENDIDDSVRRLAGRIGEIIPRIAPILSEEESDAANDVVVIAVGAQSLDDVLNALDATMDEKGLDAEDRFVHCLFRIHSAARGLGSENTSVSEISKFLDVVEEKLRDRGEEAMIEIIRDGQAEETIIDRLIGSVAGSGHELIARKAMIEGRDDENPSEQGRRA
jgi:hypothetical protein